MSLVESVRQAGVVGAGGGGFPAHVKLAARADTIIANGAECEPLLHKDAVIMERAAPQLVEGLLLAKEAVGAREAVIGIKGKKKRAVEAVREAAKGTDIRIQLLGDYYPAGDEYDLVYEVTGRLIPPAGIPIQVGAVVNNVETFVNIAAAAKGQPVTEKMLTIAGAVRTPLTLRVPLGVSYRDCIVAAGGLTTDDPVLLIGGLMMGQTSLDLDTPVTKTATGVVVLPRNHQVVERKLKPPVAQAKIGKSACDQCRYCTEYCPRFLLGYGIEPHQVMRSLAFTATGADYWNQWAALCCSCGLCTLFACPEELFPKEACDASKAVMRQANLKWNGPTAIKVHPMRDGRHVPIKTLTRKLHVDEYDVPAPFQEMRLQPKRLVLPLRQSAGPGSLPTVNAGDQVARAQVIAAPAQNTLGALLHAPAASRVSAVTQSEIVLEPKL